MIKRRAGLAGASCTSKVWSSIMSIPTPRSMRKPASAGLRLQPFSSQPYELVAAVFQKAGQDDYAKDVLIAEEWDRPRRTVFERAWLFPLWD